MMRRCEDVKMRRCEDVKMWRCLYVKARRCEDLKMWRWEDVSMWTCEHVKMYSRPPLLEEPFAQMLSGKKPGGNNILFFSSLQRTLIISDQFHFWQIYRNCPDYRWLQLPLLLSTLWCLNLWLLFISVPNLRVDWNISRMYILLIYIYMYVYICTHILHVRTEKVYK